MPRGSHKRTSPRKTKSHPAPNTIPPSGLQKTGRRRSSLSGGIRLKALPTLSERVKFANYPADVSSTHLRRLFAYDFRLHMDELEHYSSQLVTTALRQIEIRIHGRQLTPSEITVEQKRFNDRMAFIQRTGVDTALTTAASTGTAFIMTVAEGAAYFRLRECLYVLHRIRHWEKPIAEWLETAHLSYVKKAINNLYAYFVLLDGKIQLIPKIWEPTQLEERRQASKVVKSELALGDAYGTTTEYDRKGNKRHRRRKKPQSKRITRCDEKVPVSQYRKTFPRSESVSSEVGSLKEAMPGQRSVTRSRSTIEPETTDSEEIYRDAGGADDSWEQESQMKKRGFPVRKEPIFDRKAEKDRKPIPLYRYSATRTLSMQRYAAGREKADAERRKVKHEPVPAPMVRAKVKMENADWSTPKKASHSRSGRGRRANHTTRIPKLLASEHGGYLNRVSSCGSNGSRLAAGMDPDFLAAMEQKALRQMQQQQQQQQQQEDQQHNQDHQQQSQSQDSSVVDHDFVAAMEQKALQQQQQQSQQEYFEQPQDQQQLSSTFDVVDTEQLHQELQQFLQQHSTEPSPDQRTANSAEFDVSQHASEADLHQQRQQHFAEDVDEAAQKTRRRRSHRYDFPRRQSCKPNTASPRKITGTPPEEDEDINVAGVRFMETRIQYFAALIASIIDSVIQLVEKLKHSPSNTSSSVRYINVFASKLEALKRDLPEPYLRPPLRCLQTRLADYIKLDLPEYEH